MTLRFVSAGAAHAVVSTLARKAGISIDGHFGAVGAMLDKFRSGEPCDVVILTRAQIRALAGEGLVAADAIADVGTVATSIAVRADQPAPIVDDAGALRAALLAADAIYVPDPTRSTAGVHFMKVLDQLEIRAAIGERLHAHPNGATAMRTMAAAEGHPIGCTQATEILATPGVRLVAPLPRGLQLETVYTAAVNATAANEAQARAFVAHLGSDESRAARERAGFLT